jgi:hypothetical protein
VVTWPQQPVGKRSARDKAIFVHARRPKSRPRRRPCRAAEHGSTRSTQQWRRGRSRSRAFFNGLLGLFVGPIEATGDCRIHELFFLDLKVGSDRQQHSASYSVQALLALPPSGRRAWPPLGARVPPQVLEAQGAFGTPERLSVSSETSRREASPAGEAATRLLDPADNSSSTGGTWEPGVSSEPSHGWDGQRQANQRGLQPPLGELSQKICSLPVFRLSSQVRVASDVDVASVEKEVLMFA